MAETMSASFTSSSAKSGSGSAKSTGSTAGPNGPAGSRKDPFWVGVCARTQQSLQQHPILWLIGGLLLIRAAFIWCSPLDLIADESYYWDWSRRLDYGYYSKPPMIAWINWVSTSVLGSHEFAVRLPAALLGTLGLLWVFHLGATLFSYRVGLFSVVLLALTPGQTAMSFLMTIDAPFLFCWVAALYCFWQMTAEAKPEWRWCVLTACWLGLGILSKQTMLAFYPLTGLYLLTSAQRRALLKSPRLWGTAIAGLLFLLPVVFWNYRNDWITMQHTASHFQHASVTWLMQLTRFAEFLAGQVGVVSPVLWVAVMWSLIVAGRQYFKLSDAEKYLFCFSGVPLLGVILLSATRRLEPNWPAAFYPAGVILTTAILLGRSTVVDAFRNRNLQLKRAWQVGLVCTLLTYAAITVVPASPLAGSVVDITYRLRGWKELARQFEQVQKSQRGHYGSRPVIVATAGRDITSALAFYLPDQPRVSFWSSDFSGVNCQYDLWARPELREHADVLVVAVPEAPFPPSLQSGADRWEVVGQMSVDMGQDRKREYQVYRAWRSPQELAQLRKNATPQSRAAQTAWQKPATNSQIQ